MGAATALKKINAEAKRLRKKHPNAKYSTLQKQAGKAYKAGKLKKVGAIKKKKKAAPRKRRKIAAVGAVRVIYRAPVVVKKAKRRRSRKLVKAVRKSRRRVSGVMSGMKSMAIPLLLVGGGFLLYELLKPKAVTSTGLIVRTNPAAAANAQSTLTLAQTLGLAGPALTALINSLNSTDDGTVATSNPASTVQAIQNQNPTATVTAGDPTLPSWVTNF